MRTVRIFSLAAVAAAAIASGSTGGVAATATAGASSTSFAGYAAAVSGAVTATTNFKLEAITCTKSSEGIAPGVVLVNSATSVVSSGSIFESCLSGTPAYSAVATVNNVTSVLAIPVAAGHKISIIVAVSSAATTVEIDDVTIHVGKAAGGAGGTPNKLNVGINPLSSGTLLDVPTFLSERFNSTKVNGAPLRASHPTAIDRVTSRGVLQIRTSGLNVTGVGFTETFQHH
jgi:hypothetical protein